MSESWVFLLLVFAGFSNPEARRMTCVAKYESGFNPNATNTNRTGTKDIGLFQINNHFWTKGPNKCVYTEKELLDPRKNIICALHIYKIQGPTAWVAYKKHKKECDNYRLPGD